MTCYAPLEAWRAHTPNENGKRPLVFSLSQGDPDSPVQVPCGQCIGCRLEYSRQWAVRIMHEAQCHSETCFLTLTYDQAHLPYPPTIRLDHFQKFMKRLRFATKLPIRFFHCGEYGDKGGRPHYHACIFGWNPSDRVLFSVQNQNRLYTSDSLTDLWGHGFASVGALTFASAAYVARYVTKKVNGDAAHEEYRFMDEETGEVFDLRPPHCTMSRRPGIGAKWFDRYHADVTTHDIVVMDGSMQKPPGFYDECHAKTDAKAAAANKRKRKTKALKRRADNTSRRLKDRETVKNAQISNLKRSL